MLAILNFVLNAIKAFGSYFQYSEKDRPKISIEEITLDKENVKFYRGENVSKWDEAQIYTDNICYLIHDNPNAMKCLYIIDDSRHLDYYSLFINLCPSKMNCDDLRFVINALKMVFKVDKCDDKISKITYKRAFSISKNEDMSFDIKDFSASFEIKDGSINEKIVSYISYASPIEASPSLILDNIYERIINNTTAENTSDSLLLNKELSKKIIGFRATGYLIEIELINHKKYTYSMVLELNKHTDYLDSYTITPGDRDYNRLRKKWRSTLEDNGIVFNEWTYSERSNTSFLKL
jgi:hypothetical protein